MVTLESLLRRMYGHVIERATLARELLLPAARHLSWGPVSFHSRCILAQRLDHCKDGDELHADLAKFGDIEAIVLCRHLHMAVIVFRDEASVPIAFWRQEEASHGVYSAVPPPDLALPTCFIHPSLIKVNLYPATTTATGDSVSVSAEREPTRTETTSHGANTQTMPLWMESRPAIVFQNYISKGPGSSSTSFVPSRRSLIHGPTLGADGHLWIDGTYVTRHSKSIEINRGSIQVVQVPQLLYQSEADEHGSNPHPHHQVGSHHAVVI